MDDRILKLDFGSLRTLQLVHDLESFTQASAVLGQTQSNVSYTINRLRKLFGDPLFVREGGQTRATARCSDIVQTVTGLMGEFEGLVSEQAFDSQNVEGRVTLSCNHYERVTVLPSLIRFLRTKAPGLRIRSIAANTFGGEQLKRGECDLVIGPVPIQGENVFKRTLRRDRYVLVLDPDHHLAQKALSVGDMHDLPNVAISFAGHWQPLYASAFQSQGISLNTVVEVAEHGDVGGYVFGTDLVAIVPEQIAARLDTHLVMRELPFEVAFTIDMNWTTRTHRSPLHMWLRGVISRFEKTTED